MSKKTLLEIKAYIKRESDNNEIRNELDLISELYTEISNPKLYEYVPVKIVAVIQDYFRKKYKEIMDSPDYRQNIKDVKALKNVSYDFEVLGGFQDSEITLGDYLSYLIPCNSIETINCTISQLLGVDFMNKFKAEFENATEVLEVLSKVFVLRHMYCHEVPVVEPLTYEDISQMINAANDFIKQSESVILSMMTIEGEDPHIFLEEIKNRYNKRKLELESLIATFKKNHPEGDLFSGLLNFIEEWKIYCDARGKATASVTNDTIFYQLIYYVTVEQLTADFIRELNKNSRYLIFHK